MTEPSYAAYEPHRAVVRPRLCDPAAHDRCWVRQGPPAYGNLGRGSYGCLGCRDVPATLPTAGRRLASCERLP